VLELNEAAIHAVQAWILRSLGKGVDREKITAPQKDDILDRLSYTTEVSSLADRDLIIEAVVEDLEVKRHLLGQLAALCPKHRIFASNTSSRAITDLSATVGRAGRYQVLNEGAGWLKAIQLQQKNPRDAAQGTLGTSI